MAHMLSRWLVGLLIILSPALAGCADLEAPSIDDVDPLSPRRGDRGIDPDGRKAASTANASGVWTATAIDTDGDGGHEWIEVTLAEQASRDLSGDEFLLTVGYLTDANETLFAHGPCKTPEGSEDPADHTGEGDDGCDVPFQTEDTWSRGGSIFMLCLGEGVHDIGIEFWEESPAGFESTQRFVEISCQAGPGQRAGDREVQTESGWLSAFDAARLTEAETGAEVYGASAHVSMAKGDPDAAGYSSDTPAPAGGVGLLWEVSARVGNTTYWCQTTAEAVDCEERSGSPENVSRVIDLGYDSTDAYDHWAANETFAAFTEDHDASLLVSIQTADWADTLFRGVVTGSEKRAGGTWHWDPIEGIDRGTSYDNSGS